MPRYEFVEGSSKKFWEIALEGSSFTTTYGRIGTEGQMSMKEYDSDDKAQKEYEKLIAEKTKKGYALVDGSGAAPAPAAKPAAKDAKAPAKSAAVFDDEGDDDDDDAPKAKAAPKAPAKAAAPKAAPSAGASKSGEDGARYFEFIDAKSSKFWEIKLEGSSFTTRYGKIGTDGQISMKEYDSEAKSRAEYEKLIAEKTKKGYAEK